MIKNAQTHTNHFSKPVTNDLDSASFYDSDALVKSHNVLYEQNNIDTRLQNHDQPYFVVAETCFNNGLNFLNVWQRFTDHLARQQVQNQLDKGVKRLHFISFDTCALTVADLSKILKMHPAINSLSKQLIEQYPINLEGCHRLEFNNGLVVLDLYFGEITNLIKVMSYPKIGIVDAWFLNNSSTNTIPKHYQQSLFNAITDITKTGATIATYETTECLNNELVKAGFTIQKVKDFASTKNEILVGTLNKANNIQSAPDYFSHGNSSLKSVAVIGGGIASSCILYSLAKRGIESQLFCQDSKPAMGASHNVQGAIYPHLQAKNSPHSELFAHSFLYAKRLYNHLLNTGFSFDYDWCGVLQHAVKQPLADKHQNLAQKQLWPKSLMRNVTAQQGDEIAGINTGYSGVYFEQGGWVNPPQLVNAMLNAANNLTPFKSSFNCNIEQLEKTDDGWFLSTNGERLGPFSDVIICAGEHSDAFEQTKSLPIVGVRGQVSHVQASEQSRKLKTVLCHKGYFTPAYLDHHCMGATFEKNSKSRQVTEQDNITNKEQLLSFYDQSEFATSLGNITSAKAAVRCSFIDHLPMAGEWAQQSDYITAFANLRLGKRYQYQPLNKPQQGLHIFTGFGARALCSAPLSSEHLISSLNNEPRPLSERVSQAIHPARFIVRNLMRNKI
ncbi:FAD-dependent 5-carboxymethylaminomethyl-2-thiouridine(34) oxidoreductase MnmC [Pseudoalteromonas sp. TB64]|uniref:FAD-dependent 5-carboxymethylaminomethyl-2-thiouridine(34) oxidoreductase MnmC n=1 Tax=Pseudoalteromonas sp. TB64 TaxID=1938600 RepID=UPI000464A91A|nr:FAD-dependent 5-carboxymethylaminomethyl-2-thiouridine(34) oxidoreductase MnmC [Pseudoalteromonas sp. TB64]